MALEAIAGSFTCSYTLPVLGARVLTITCLLDNASEYTTVSVIISLPDNASAIACVPPAAIQVTTVARSPRLSAEVRLQVTGDPVGAPCGLTVVWQDGTLSSSTGQCPATVAVFGADKA